jgi:7-carboxy-7-deazaguanine synthase
MFGTNEVVSPFPKPNGRLLVNSIFYTIQGEGPDAGCTSVFLRLSKCNLRCYFCDTEFDKGEELSAGMVCQKINDIRRGCKLVVITGGEPLLQNFLPVVNWCNSIGMAVSIETAGTLYLKRLEKFFAPDRSIAGNLIVCSPKTPKLNERLIPLIGALKYVVCEDDNSDDGLPTMSTQQKGKEAPVFRPTPDMKCPIYVQALDACDPEQNKRNLAAAADAAMKHNYRLSVQLHKIAGLP